MMASLLSMYSIHFLTKVFYYCHICIEYIKESFKIYLTTNPSLSEYEVSDKSLQVTSGYLKISNDTVFMNQGSILSSVFSTIIIDGAIISDTTSSTSFIDVIETTVTIENMKVKNISTDSNSRLITISS